MWISHNYVYVPSFLNLPPLTPFHPLGCHRELGWAPCFTYELSDLHMLIYMFQCYFLSLSHCSFPCCVHKSKFCLILTNLNLNSDMRIPYWTIPCWIRRSQTCDTCPCRQLSCFHRDMPFGGHILNYCKVVTMFSFWGVVSSYWYKNFFCIFFLK